jgi:hypothetical protein
MRRESSSSLVIHSLINSEDRPGELLVSYKGVSALKNQLRGQRPNIGNKQELLCLMDVARVDRRSWLKHSYLQI